MKNHELIGAITEEANEIKNFSTSGGYDEQAFDLWADTSRLQSILDELTQLGTAIRIESGNLHSNH